MINIFPASPCVTFEGRLAGALWPPSLSNQNVGSLRFRPRPICQFLNVARRGVHKLQTGRRDEQPAHIRARMIRLCVIAIDSYICAHRRRSDHFLGKLSPLIFKPSLFASRIAAWVCDCEKLLLWKFLLWFSAARTWVGWNHKPERCPLKFYKYLRNHTAMHFRSYFFAIEIIKC